MTSRTSPSASFLSTNERRTRRPCARPAAWQGAGPAFGDCPFAHGEGPSGSPVGQWEGPPGSPVGQWEGPLGPPRALGIVSVKDSSAWTAVRVGTQAHLLLLLAFFLAAHALGLPGAQAGVPVFLKGIELATTHEWFTTPTIYFQCDGEDKKYLTNVIRAHVPYNFTFYESFQPITELVVPKCKRCGLFEEDFWKKDDVFDRFELCPLEFSEPPEGQLVWRAPKEANITFQCFECNTKNAAAGGVVLSGPNPGNLTNLSLFLIALGAALGVSIVVVFVVYCLKERSWLFKREKEDDAKFMRMFEGDDDDFLDDDLDVDVELARQDGEAKHQD